MIDGCIIKDLSIFRSSFSRKPRINGKGKDRSERVCQQIEQIASAAFHPKMLNQFGCSAQKNAPTHDDEREYHASESRKGQCQKGAFDGKKDEMDQLVGPGKGQQRKPRHGTGL